MKRLYFIILACAFFCLASAQHVVRSYIPHGAIFYNTRWQGVSSADKASYYRVLAVDDSGHKIFYDYFITGQLQAEKHYTSINKHDDRHTVLNGVCRTFHKSGRGESVLQYKNGKADGRALSFFPSGNIGMKLTYRNGVLDGPCYTYNENGRLEYTTIWRNGSKVNEIKGGKDHYIDKITNEDDFCERFRRDEALIMAQSKSISKAREDAGLRNKGEAKDVRKTGDYIADSKGIQPESGGQSKVKGDRPARTAVRTKRGKQMTEEEKLIANVKYPDGPKGNAAPVKGEKYSNAAMSPQGSFSFPYLYSLLSKDDERTQSIGALAGLSRNFKLSASQIIDGYGIQKEIIFHYNMVYDAQSGKDKITGKNPRQIAYFGTVTGNNLSLERIKMFTWSKDEMYHIAQEAISAGYQILGNIDYLSTDGNFILEPKTIQIGYDEREVIITFTHQPNLYGGIYHIQMDVR